MNYFIILLILLSITFQCFLKAKILHKTDEKDVAHIGHHHLLEGPQLLIHQLSSAIHSHYKAAQELKTLRDLLKKGFDRRATFRDDDPSGDVNSLLSVLAKISSGCSCNASITVMQKTIDTSFSALIGSEHLLCAALSDQSAFKTEECVFVTKLLFKNSLNVTVELISEDLLCETSTDNCEKNRGALGKNQVISCKFCEMLHAKAFKEMAECLECKAKKEGKYQFKLSDGSISSLIGHLRKVGCQVPESRRNRKFRCEEQWKYDATNCAAHLLDRSVKNSFGSKQGAISELFANCRRIVSRVKHSIKALDELKEVQELEGNGCSLELFFDNDQTFVGTEGRN
uniref:Uncharacterized protein n=1 Tax=Globodera rostochiensis TaxID=31243 RepID=A0A914HJ91_GLORO